MLKHLITVSILFIASISQAGWVSMYVYCAKPDGSDWGWLKQPNGEYATVFGYMDRQSKPPHQYFHYHRIKQYEYDLLKNQCKTGYVPQPAKTNGDGWYVFQVEDLNGNKSFAEGYRTLYRDPCSITDHYRDPRCD
ncbi:hypothetical protein [Spartinivicinus poritis]|uniref:Secreted protein n=1 Tax=Spartinivicinus poritis TaxID=2994640 RepID=A0ABT5U4F0_9GAMM|nr:hypothetical protein [Spartinivicinus sp. A2-2]MDE1461192.1 hypothetical protein [Spartinivicinus sp. A2-2]